MGAAAIPVTMLVGGPGDESADSGRLIMAPGLGLLPDIVIDSHFAQRGRIGRLLGTVALNPKNLGIGIDEDTAIIVERGQFFQVIGSGAVYITQRVFGQWSMAFRTVADLSIEHHVGYSPFLNHPFREQLLLQPSATYHFLMAFRDGVR